MREAKRRRARDAAQSPTSASACAAVGLRFVLTRTGYLPPRAETQSGARTSVWAAELAAETEKLLRQTVYVAAHVYNYMHEILLPGVVSSWSQKRGGHAATSQWQGSFGGLPRVLLRSRQAPSSHDSASIFIAKQSASRIMRRKSHRRATGRRTAGSICHRVATEGR